MAVQIKKDKSLIQNRPAGVILLCQDRKYGNLCPTGEARAGQRLRGEPYKFLSELGPLCAMHRGLLYLRGQANFYLCLFLNLW